MTSQGSPYARFQRALATGNPTIVSAAAAELPPLQLEDAFAVCLTYLPSDPARFERALVRWHALYCLEQRPRADEAQLVLAAMRALAGPARSAAVDALLDLFETRQLRGATRFLERWLRQ